MTEPKKYTKIPVTIEAIEWDGKNRSAITCFFRTYGFEGFLFDLSRSEVKIKTLEGEMTATRGDWIIRGVAGEFYPCKPEIFHSTYQEEIACLN